MKFIDRVLVLKRKQLTQVSTQVFNQFNKGKYEKKNTFSEEWKKNKHD